MAKGVILMTALPPTEGHVALIRFAAEFMAALPGGSTEDLTVILSRRPGEPGDREFHVDALRSIINHNMFSGRNVKFRLDEYDGPENPEPGNEEDFWQRWARVIHYKVMEFPDYIFSSETYGYRMAEEITKRALEEFKYVRPCVHIPFNLSRDQNMIRATDVRADPVAHWQQLIPSMRARYTQSICFFGQESVGKTTLTRKSSELFGSVYLNEWARPYLEGLSSPHITTERMFTIMYGQAALERSAAEQYYTPFRFYDTDLLSTLGYWELWYDQAASQDTRTYETFRGQLRQLWKPKDLYIIPRDNIPFTPDPLRYGGDKRETDTLYWINLCERYKLRYYVLQESSIAGRMEEVEDQCRKQLKRALGFEGYVRDK